MECAGEEPIEDIDIPVSGRYEDDFYINLLMAMIAMMATIAMTAMLAMLAMMAMMKTIVTRSKVNDRRWRRVNWKGCGPARQSNTRIKKGEEKWEIENDDKKMEREMTGRCHGYNCESNHIERPIHT